MNVVKTAGGLFIEVQGTAETRPFDRAALDNLLALADDGIKFLVEKQRELSGGLSSTEVEVRRGKHGKSG